MITHLKLTIRIVLFGLFFGNAMVALAQVELPLWPDGIPNNPVNYKEEKIRTEPVSVVPYPEEQYFTSSL